MILSGERKSCKVRLTVALVLLVLTETTSFPREENDPGFAVEYEVPRMEVEEVREDRRLGESKYGSIEGGKDKFREMEDPTGTKTGDKMNRLRREVDSNDDEVRTSKSKVDKKYRVGSGTEKKGRRKTKMAEPEVDPKRDSIKARARRQTQKPEKVDKYVREMGYYVPKAKNDCASRPDKGNCAKRVERDTGMTRANLTSPEYYAQRKKVMERFYARQREISEKYDRLNSTSSGSVTIRNQTDVRSVTGSPASIAVNSVKFETTAQPTTVQPTTTKASPATFDNGVRFNLLTGNGTYARKKYEGKFWNSVSPTDRHPFNVDVRINPAFSTYSSTDSPQLEYNWSNQNCSLEGSVPQKIRKKKFQRPGCADSKRGDMDDPPDISPGEGYVWGRCSGRVVYQHNLLLGLKGTSKLDAIFEVGIEGPICITCVTAQRFNDTRAIVTLESGGRGENFAKLRLIGFENEGFSYILKIFGVGKTNNDCRNI